MKTLSRRTFAGVVTAGVLLATGGCSMFSGTQVLEPAQLSDGVSTDLGEVHAGALVVVGDKGQPGVLTGALTNDGAQPVTVTIGAEGLTTPTQVQVPAGSLVRLGAQGADGVVVIPSLAVPAGAMTNVQLSSPAAGQVQVQVPVLSTDLPYYATVTPPSGATGAPTTVPGVTESPSATDTQEPTTSPS